MSCRRVEFARISESLARGLENALPATRLASKRTRFLMFFAPGGMEGFFREQADLEPGLFGRMDDPSVSTTARRTCNALFEDLAGARPRRAISEATLAISLCRTSPRGTRSADRSSTEEAFVERSQDHNAVVCGGGECRRQRFHLGWGAYPAQGRSSGATVPCE